MAEARATLARAVAHAIDALGAGAPADLLAWRGRVDLFYNPNHDERGRFAENDSGGGGGVDTSTPEFQAWFGNSKITNGSGEPKIVYHGTNATFNEFDESRIGSSTDEGWLGRGIYFSTDQNIGSQNTVTKQVFIKAENPLRIEMTGWGDKRPIVRDALGLPRTATAYEVTAAAKAAGHDSIILDYSPVGYRQQEIVVFSASQVRVAGSDIPTVRRDRSRSDHHSMADAYAARGTGVPGRRRKEVEAVNAYQDELESEYEDWADDAATQLAAEPDDDKRRELLLALLLLLLARLKRLQELNYPDAVTLGLGTLGKPGVGGSAVTTGSGGTSTAAAWQALADALKASDGALTTSTLPAIKAAVQAALASQDFALALAQDTAEAKSFLASTLGMLKARVSQGANAFWGLLNQARGIGLDADSLPVMWLRDNSIPLDKHCEDCLRYGDREYSSYREMLKETGGLFPGSYELKDAGNCRCQLVEVEPD